MRRKEFLVLSATFFSQCIETKKESNTKSNKFKNTLDYLDSAIRELEYYAEQEGKFHEPNKTNAIKQLDSALNNLQLYQNQQSITNIIKNIQTTKDNLIEVRAPLTAPDYKIFQDSIKISYIQLKLLD